MLASYALAQKNNFVTDWSFNVLELKYQIPSRSYVRCNLTTDTRCSENALCQLVAWHKRSWLYHWHL